MESNYIHLQENALVLLKEKYKSSIDKLKKMLWDLFVDKYEENLDEREIQPEQQKLRSLYESCKKDLITHLIPHKQYFPEYTEKPEQIVNEVMKTYTISENNLLKNVA